MQRTSVPPWVQICPKVSAERVTRRWKTPCRGRNEHGYQVESVTRSCEPRVVDEPPDFCCTLSHGDAKLAMVHPMLSVRQRHDVAHCGLGSGPSEIHATRSTAKFRIDNPGRRDRSITRGPLPWATMFNAFSV